MITENEIETLALTWFQDSGWEFRHGPDLAPDGETPERTDYRQVVFASRLREALQRLNPGVPEAVLDEVLHRVVKLQEPSLVQSNRRFHEALIDGLPVDVEQDGVKRGDRVRLIDFEQQQANRYLVVNQYTVQGTRQPRRPDLVCFINGLADRCHRAEEPGRTSRQTSGRRSINSRPTRPRSRTCSSSTRRW